MTWRPTERLTEEVLAELLYSRRCAQIMLLRRSHLAREDVEDICGDALVYLLEGIQADRIVRSEPAHYGQAYMRACWWHLNRWRDKRTVRRKYAGELKTLQQASDPVNLGRRGLLQAEARVDVVCLLRQLPPRAIAIFVGRILWGSKLTAQQEGVALSTVPETVARVQKQLQREFPQE
jgi:DNA-directed RNA polymerase specialized sigma24 family protein